MQLPFEQRDDRPLRSIYLDLNAYFASVEQAEDPSLRGIPVGVCPVMADTSFIIAASYEAKKFGVKTGTQIGQAKQMCPDIKLVPAHPSMYVSYHQRVLDVVETVLPIQKVCSIDEMKFQLIGEEREPWRAKSIALELKDALRELVSPVLTASIGIAPNSFLAKLGTDLQKPDGLVVIESKDLPGRIEGLDLTEFCGINRRMAARLNSAGLFSSTDLVHASRSELVRAFGSLVGERWYYLLRGYEVELAETERKSLGHSHVLPPDLRNDEGTREVLLRLASKATARLRANNLYATAIAVRVSGFDRTWQAKARIDPTHDTVKVVSEVLRLWESRDFARPRSVGITFYDLVEPDGVTFSLFDTTQGRETFNRAMDDINQRFGKNTIYLAGLHRARDTAKEKIAFNKTWLFKEGKDDHAWPDTFRGIPRPPIQELVPADLAEELDFDPYEDW
ncbi:MAG: DNA polymerase [Armatimonadetes bacterium]|nr:DNA polymerase [Armatimonadota bacterium]